MLNQCHGFSTDPVAATVGQNLILGVQVMGTNPGSTAPKITAKCYFKGRWEVLIAYCTLIEPTLLKTWQKKLEVANFKPGNEELYMLNKSEKKCKNEIKIRKKPIFQAEGCPFKKATFYPL